MNVKQVIVVRTDLQMPAGKMAAQVAHASIGSLLTLFRKFNTSDQDSTRFELEFKKDSILDAWLNGIFTKIVLGVGSVDELLTLESHVQLEMPSAVITDAGLTVFNGEPTITCLGIGPYISEDIDHYTKHLKLYR